MGRVRHEGNKQTDSSLSYLDAVKGRHFRIAMESYFPPYVDLSNDSGHVLDVIKEMASRGGFAYTIVDIGSPASGQTWTAFIQATVDSAEYDLIGSYYSVTNARLDANWVFTYPFVDISDMLLAQIPSEIEKDLLDRMSIFVAPFSVYVWLVLVAIVIGAGFIHWYADRDRREENRETWKQFVLRKMNLRKKKYYYMMTAIEKLQAEKEKEGGADEDAGRSKKSVGIQDTTEKDPEKAVQEMANKIGWDEEAALDYMDPLGRPEANVSRYPQLGASIFMKAMALGSLGPKANPFSGAAKTHLFIFSFLIFIVTAAYTANLATFLLKDGYVAANEQCDMRVVGSPIVRKGAGFVQLATNDCQEPVRYAIDTILVGMEEDGFLQIDDEFQPSVGLTLESFSGIFVAYGVIAIVTVIFAYIRARTRKHTDFLLSKAKQDVSKRLQGIPGEISKRRTLLLGESPLAKQTVGEGSPENPDEREPSFGMERENEEDHQQVLQADEEPKQQGEEEEESICASIGRKAAAGGEFESKKEDSLASDEAPVDDEIEGGGMFINTVALNRGPSMKHR
uniref:Ionotropic glutamate receptor C-terminal domain-containing protein n=1 Tax=Chromera velia CCMP2878 TaxID=1169474 RepID=A0A0G4I1Z7_9ALVE|eukprot:Cvel_10238.t1-p1 / transcript=Cvel_10238.t1 / gene=Cvel_10238 / organism=Chromera_velia_CCMP2878 / gene_product=hypothetical protein / transcript_product=hypothetical protein / location=Cvel_scaffold613:32421-39171(+) / protein_length=565 / sequence_SO=supercontig / SO=protein_coding / is_pseudo=false